MTSHKRRRNGKTVFTWQERKVSFVRVLTIDARSFFQESWATFRQFPRRRNRVFPIVDDRRRSWTILPRAGRGRGSIEQTKDRRIDRWRERERATPQTETDAGVWPWNSGKLANRGWLHRGFVSGTNRRGSGCREEKGRKRGGGARGRSEREKEEGR